jgi:hypothetical protein
MTPRLLRRVVDITARPIALWTSEPLAPIEIDAQLKPG